TIDWGDGSAPQVFAYGADADGAQPFSLTHTYATAPLVPPTITVGIQDDDQAAATPAVGPDGTLLAPDEVSGAPGSAIPLNLETLLTGGNSMRVTLSSLPEGVIVNGDDASLVGGFTSAPGTDSVTITDLNNLTFTFPGAGNESFSIQGTTYDAGANPIGTTRLITLGSSVATPAAPPAPPAQVEAPEPPAPAPTTPTITDVQTEQPGDEEGLTVESERLLGLLNAFQSERSDFGLGNQIFVGFQVTPDGEQPGAEGETGLIGANRGSEESPLNGLPPLTTLSPIFAGIGSPGSYVQIEVVTAGGSTITQSSYVDGAGNWLVSFDQFGDRPAEVRVTYTPAISGGFDPAGSSSAVFSGASLPTPHFRPGLSLGDIFGRALELVSESESGLDDALEDGQ
ncbi:MAG: hypothetical protein AAGH89_04165, partial [Verrucomicrobiota bacterium]